MLTGEFSVVAFGVALIPFFLVNNLLLLNQFPDIEPDRGAGRDNFPIALGTERSAMIYGLFGLLAYLSLVCGALSGLFPVSALLGLMTAVLTYQVFKGARAYAGGIDQLLPYMGKNVVVALATPLLLTVSLLLDAF